MNADFKLGLGLDPNGRIADDLSQLVGNTPMVNLNGFQSEYGLLGSLAAKLEYFNPLGSAKDRAARQIVNAAELDGSLKPDGVIAEATSGNMGVSLAFIASLRGYKLKIFMPENMSAERIRLIKALGAEVFLTPANEGMQGAVDAVSRLKENDPAVFVPNQFSNPANAIAHELTTGPEILRDAYGKINYFIAGVGSGGTITGVGRVLKAFRADIRVIAVEPDASPVLSGGEPGKHNIMGIGAGFVPEILDRSVIDDIVRVTDEQAYEAARTVAKTDGLLVGVSSGAALYAARMIAQRAADRHARVVVLLPDGGERYLSTALFDV